MMIGAMTSACHKTWRCPKSAIRRPSPMRSREVAASSSPCVHSSDPTISEVGTSIKSKSSHADRESGAASSGSANMSTA